MLSGKRRSSLRRNRENLKREIEDQELDYPAAMEQDWDLYRLGRRDEHLFLADLGDPIEMTGAEATVEYVIPVNMTLHKIVLYQREDDDVTESDAVLGLRINLLHPNNTPEVIYNKQGVSWLSGGERISGRTYMPASIMQVVHNGTLNYLLYLSLELEVHGVA